MAQLLNVQRDLWRNSNYVTLPANTPDNFSIALEGSTYIGADFEIQESYIQGIRSAATRLDLSNGGELFFWLDNGVQPLENEQLRVIFFRGKGYDYANTRLYFNRPSAIDRYYIHNQDTPSLTWTVNHNFGIKGFGIPRNVYVTNVLGEPFGGFRQELYNDNTLIISFPHIPSLPSGSDRNYFSGKVHVT